jgi:hypothetical protein
MKKNYMVQNLGHPFVEIQRDRIGPLHPGELGLDVLCQDRHGADRAIHVEPQVFLRT